LGQCNKVRGRAALREMLWSGAFIVEGTLRTILWALHLAQRAAALRTMFWGGALRIKVIMRPVQRLSYGALSPD
jgi:hypothetical protein